MDLQIRSWTFGSRDYSWLASKHGTDAPKTATLLVSAATEATHYPDGFIKSGTLLAKYTSGANEGLWAPYVNDGSLGLNAIAGIVLDGFDITRNVGTGAIDSTRVMGSVILANSGVYINVSKLPGLLLDDGTTAYVPTSTVVAAAGFVPVDLS